MSKMKDTERTQQNTLTDEQVAKALKNDGRELGYGHSSFRPGFFAELLSEVKNPRNRINLYLAETNKDLEKMKDNEEGREILKKIAYTSF